MQPLRILLVLTSATRMPGNDAPTGVWLEEAAAPYYTFLDARCVVTLASPLGGPMPVDPRSTQTDSQTASTRRLQADAKAHAAFAATHRLSTLDPAAYDAIYFAGGHGTMADFPSDPAVRAAVEAFAQAGKPLAAVCHGPACFVAARKADGTPLIAGHRFTCFTDEEERAVGLADTVPFLLETRLNEQGGSSENAAPFAKNIIRSGELFTGQNPASAIALAEAVIHALRQRAGESFAA